MADTTTLKEIYGKALTPKELAVFLGVDYRTIIKYAETWGGVEVSPGKYRFFENIIRRKLDAQFDNKEKKKEMEGECNVEWDTKRKTVLRRLDSQQTQRNNMGEGGKRETGEKTDRHGLLKSA